MEKKCIAVLHLYLLMLHQVSFYELRYIFYVLWVYDKWLLSTLPAEFCPTWGTVGEESQTPGWTSDAHFPAVVFVPTREGQ